jgi:tRNA G10  N-methylase Trm11
MEDKSLLILGRQPALGLAELESLYGSKNVRLVGGDAALVDAMPCAVDFVRLGGSVKLCKILTVLEAATWQKIIAFLASASPGQAAKMPEGKMHLGLSIHGFTISPAKISAGGLTIKKSITKTGRNVQLVPNNTAQLGSAQVIHHKLTTKNGWELVIIKDGSSAIIAQTVAVQDIASYTRRDRGRPKRDPRVGMLPPKLAQIIINLAVGEDELAKMSLSEGSKICISDAENEELRKKRAETTILDPFCGTGVMLQEALLMGYSAYGSELEQRMVDYSQTNLDWLKSRLKTRDSRLERSDATTATWDLPRSYAIASETYLGQAYNSLPSPDKLAQNMRTCNKILTAFLQNLADQISSGTRLCLAVPAWQISPSKFRRLPLLDQLAGLGYNQVEFEHAHGEDLIYARENQIVARELLILTKQ